ncbi:hypothetical protein Zm00014a_015943 [Zea mays]|uniref:Uncharacterized protein n=1 Tax=Zea mays TaxID=4577 RepID=A0A3L6E6F8_MAIZE|nr:hypothetical protein Zm00014a_015943 [Zea mays]
MTSPEPRQGYGIEVMYRTVLLTDCRQYYSCFERFRRLFHHSAYRALLGHKGRNILSSLWVEEDRFKQRVWVEGARPEEEEIFQSTMVQRVGGSWDGYWLTESLIINDGDAFSGRLLM